jgi:hypothetical protein
MSWVSKTVETEDRNLLSLAATKEKKAGLLSKGYWWCSYCEKVESISNGDVNFCLCGRRMEFVEGVDAICGGVGGDGLSGDGQSKR